MFGGLRVIYGPRTITRFRTKKAGALLAYLAYHVGRTFPREELIELLWPESELDRGRMSLRTELASLRRQLEPPGVPSGCVIEADAIFLRIPREAVSTDVNAFQSALEAAAAATEDAERLDCLATAAAIYTGDLLSGYYDDWIFPEREHLSASYLAALRRLTELHASSRNDALALEYAWKAVQTDPLNEEAHGDLIRLYLTVGDTEAAAGQLERLLSNLCDELAIQPSDETRRLEIEVNRRAGKRSTPRMAGASVTTSPISHSTALKEPRVTASRYPPFLPHHFTRFFGRTVELERLVQLLTPTSTDIPTLQGGGLVTLTGLGGTGKTRLALETAERLAPAYDNAVWFIALEEILDPELIPGAIADTLRLKRTPTTPVLDQVVEALSEQPVLLVLDNYEQLVLSGSSLVSALLSRISTLRCLVTSRQRLALPGEREIPLDPLPVPKDRDLLEELLEVPSVQLFVDRAQSVRPDFQITRGNAAAVSALCRRLEGIPLAIELAAARAQVLTAAQMAEMIDDRFSLLSTRQTNKLSRHRSLWAAIEWSFELLPPEVQRFFTRLSLFRGGWTLDAAQAVAAEPRAVEYLSQLRGHSLILAEERGTAFRFRLMDSLREYADHRLSVEERPALEDRHSAYYARIAEMSQYNHSPSGQAETLVRLEEEHDNLRAILQREISRDSALATSIAGDLWKFWQSHGHYREGRALLAQVLTLPSNIHPADTAATGALANVLNGAGSLAWSQGDLEVGRQYQERSLALFHAIGDRRSAGYVLIWLGNAAYHKGDYADARERYKESLNILRELGDTNGIGYSLVWLGNIESRLGRFETASEHYRESLKRARENEDLQLTAYALYGLGHAALKQGRVTEAEAFQRECLLLRQQLGERLGIVTSLESFAFIAHAQGLYDRAVELAAAAQAQRKELDVPLPPIMHKEYDTMLETPRAILSHELYTDAEARGRNLDLEQAIVLALGGGR